MTPEILAKIRVLLEELSSLGCDDERCGLPSLCHSCRASDLLVEMASEPVCDHCAKPVRPCCRKPGHGFPTHWEHVDSGMYMCERSPGSPAAEVKGSREVAA